METVVQKWGNSLGIRIPGNLAKDLHLRDGEAVEISGERDRLIIQPTRKESLKSKLKRVTGENIHSEVTAGPPRGKETW